jgi:hypothetical protein
VRTVVRWLLLFVLLPLGAVTGLASVALHQYWWGLALGVVTPLLALVALPAGWWSRLPFALGWVAMIGYLTIPRPEGDYVIGDDTAGYALLVVACVFLVAGLVTLPRRGTRGPVPPPP